MGPTPIPGRGSPDLLHLFREQVERQRYAASLATAVGIKAFSLRDLPLLCDVKTAVKQEIVINRMRPDAAFSIHNINISRVHLDEADREFISNYSIHTAGREIECPVELDGVVEEDAQQDLVTSLLSSPDKLLSGPCAIIVSSWLGYKLHEKLDLLQLLDKYSDSVMARAVFGYWRMAKNEAIRDHLSSRIDGYIASQWCGYNLIYVAARLGSIEALIRCALKTLCLVENQYNDNFKLLFNRHVFPYLSLVETESFMMSLRSVSVNINAALAQAILDACVAWLEFHKTRLNKITDQAECLCVDEASQLFLYLNHSTFTLSGQQLQAHLANAPSPHILLASCIRDVFTYGRCDSSAAHAAARNFAAHVVASLLTDDK